METNCRDCGAQVIWAVKAGTEERIPLDATEERSEGEGRYRVVNWSSPPQVESLGESYPALASVDHRVICQQGRA